VRLGSGAFFPSDPCGNQATIVTLFHSAFDVALWPFTKRVSTLAATTVTLWLPPVAAEHNPEHVVVWRPLPSLMVHRLDSYCTPADTCLAQPKPYQLTTR
jgi:hypothetical protein